MRMNDEVNLPEITEYLSIKQAAKSLNLAEKTVYQYVAEGRIPGVRAADVILIPAEEVKKFKRGISGRPRKSIPGWHISPSDNLLLTTLLLVQIKSGQREALLLRLEEIRREKQHIFPGTIARYIIDSKTNPGQVIILLIWRSSVIPDEAAREAALEAFRQALADVLDWSTAHYDDGTVLMHT